MHLLGGASGLVGHIVTKSIFFVMVFADRKASLASDHIFVLISWFALVGYGVFFRKLYSRQLDEGRVQKVTAHLVPFIISSFAYSLLIVDSINSGLSNNSYSLLILLFAFTIADIEDSLTSYVSEFTPHIVFAGLLMFLMSSQEATALAMLIAIFTLQLIRNLSSAPTQLKQIPESDLIGLIGFLFIFISNIENSANALVFLTAAITVHFVFIKTTELRLFSILSPTIVLLV